MIKLNLISPTYKKNLEVKKFIENIRDIFLYITVFVATAGIVLLIVRNDLEKNFVAAVESSSLISSQPDKTNKTVIEVNKKIDLSLQTQEGYIPWSRLLLKISAMVPDNVFFNSLNIQTKNEKGWSINISGFAATREDFLLLKKTLEENTQIFTEINTPIANIFKKEDLDFTINLKVSDYALKTLILE